MADLQKIVKLTQAQYDILASGGTVGSYTGLDPEFLYLVTDDAEYVTTTDYGLYNKAGIIKPAYSTTGTASLTTASQQYTNSPTIQARSTDSSRYYAVEEDSKGRLFVNVPWSNSTSYLSYTASQVSSGTTKNYIIGKQTPSQSGNNYYNSSVYFTNAGNLNVTEQISGGGSTNGLILYNSSQTYTLTGGIGGDNTYLVFKDPNSGDGVIKYDANERCFKFQFPN